MAQNVAAVQAQYIYGLQAVAVQMQKLNASINNLMALYNGGGLSGTFTDAEVQALAPAQHLTAALVGTYTANVQTVQTAMTTAILQNMANCVGVPNP